MQTTLQCIFYQRSSRNVAENKQILGKNRTFEVKLEAYPLSSVPERASIKKLSGLRPNNLVLELKLLKTHLRYMRADGFKHRLQNDRKK